jgi:dsDNA-specific endonuclease/ATPase MutS2
MGLPPGAEGAAKVVMIDPAAGSEPISNQNFLSIRQLHKRVRIAQPTETDNTSREYYLQSDEAEAMERLLLCPPVSLEQTQERQAVLRALSQHPGLDEFIGRKNQAYGIVRGTRDLSDYYQVSPFGRETTLFGAYIEGIGSFDIYDDNYEPVEKLEVEPSLHKGVELVRNGFEAAEALLDELPATVNQAAAVSFRDKRAELRELKQQFDELIALDGSGQHIRQREGWSDARINPEGAMIGLLWNKLSPFCSNLGSLFEYAKLIRDDGWAEVSFDADAPAGFSAAWNPTIPKHARRNDMSQVPIDSASDTPIVIYSGPNTSGKSASLSTAFMVQLAGQALGFAPAATANIHPRNTIVYLERGGTNASNDLSAFMREALTVGVVMRRLGTDALVFSDELFSTTSPEDQADLQAGVYRSVADMGGKILAATHNDLLLDNAASYPDALASLVHLAVTLEANGKLTRHFVLQPGRNNSLSLEVARCRNFPPDLLAAAEAYLAGNETLPAIIKHEYLAATPFSAQEREALAMEVDSLDWLFPTATENAVFERLSTDRQFYNLFGNLRSERAADPETSNSFLDFIGNADAFSLAQEKALLQAMVLLAPRQSAAQVLERQAMLTALLESNAFANIHDTINAARNLERSINILMSIQQNPQAALVLEDHPDLDDLNEQEVAELAVAATANLQAAADAQLDSARNLVHTMRGADSIYLKQAANYLEHQIDRCSNRLQSDSPDTTLDRDPRDLTEYEQVLQSLDALCLLADIIQTEGLAKVQFNATGDISLRDAFSVFKPKEGQIHNPLALSATERSMLLTGANGSGKTFDLKKNTAALLFGLATGYSPAAEATMPVLDNITYLDRVTEKRDATLSSYAQELAYWQQILDRTATSKASFVAVDEAFSTTSGRYQAALTYAVMQHLLQTPHFVQLATHNHDLVERIGQAAAPHHFEFTVDDNGVHFAHALKSGHQLSRALDVAKSMGLPKSVIELSQRS